MEVTRNHLMESAKKAYQSGAHNKALKLVNQILLEDDADSEAHFLKANIYHLNGKIGSAIKSFKKVLELNGDNTDAMISLSVLYNDIGKYDQAKGYFERADNKVKKSTSGVIDEHINRKFSTLHFEIAEMYFSYGRYEEALKEYEKARLLDASNLSIRVKIAKVYSKRKLVDKATTELKAVKKDGPDFLPARLALGLHYYSNGKIIEAQSEWRGILSKDKNNKEALMYLKLSQAATEVTL
jgi:tetratricopeptide (TPR) repeat protein